MTPRSYIILLAGLVNSLVVIECITTPLIATDERPWYDRMPSTTREILDPSKGLLLPSASPLGCTPRGFLGAYETWRPTPSQIARLEEDLGQFLPGVDSLVEHRYWDQHAPFVAYRRQYIGLRFMGEPPIIFVNAFIERDEASSHDWRRRMVCVDDGGTGYWHVQYDPSTRRFRRFGFNGVG